MSDANLATIATATEAALGLGGTTLQQIRFTRENFRFEKESVQSQEIRSDRQVADDQKVFGQPSGGFEFELSYAFILPFLAAALQSDWVDINTTANMTLTAATQVVAAAASTFDDVPVGAMIKIAGSGTAENNGPKRVVAKAVDGSTLTLAAGSIAADQASASLTITGKTLSNGITRQSRIFEKRLLNAEGHDYYQRYLGMCLDTMEIRIESKQLITGTTNFLGTAYETDDSGADSGAIDPNQASGTLTLTDNLDAGDTITVGINTYTASASPTDPGDFLIGADAGATIDNLVAEIMGEGIGAANPLATADPGPGDTMVVTAIYSGAIGNTVATTEDADNASWGAATLTGGSSQASGYSAPEAGPVMNGTNNVGTIRMDGAAASDRFKGITLQIANNLRGKDACGTEGNWDIGSGQFAVQGNLNAYFRNNALPAKIKAHTTFSLDFYVQDAAGNRLYFYLPAVKPRSGDPTIQGINTDVMIQTDFMAILGDTGNATGKTLIIDAIPAA